MKAEHIQLTKGVPKLFGTPLQILHVMRISLTRESAKANFNVLLRSHLIKWPDVRELDYLGPKGSQENPVIHQ